MKYKTFIAAALTVTALTADVKAACWCDTAFTGESCLNERVTSKLDPTYWGCRAFIKSIQIVCKGFVCPTSSSAATQQKFTENQKSCTAGENVQACENALTQDVTNAESMISTSISTALGQAKSELQSEIDTVAENESKKSLPKK